MLFCCCCHCVKNSFAKTVMLITYVRGTDILVKQQHTYTCVAHIFHNTIYFQTYMNICLGAHASWNWIALSCAVYDTCDCFSSNHNLYNRIKQNTRTLTQQLLAEHFAPPWKKGFNIFSDVSRCGCIWQVVAVHTRMQSYAEYLIHFGVCRGSQTLSA